MFHVLLQIVLVGFLAFTSLPGFAKDSGHADQVKLLKGATIPGGSQMTFGAEGKIAKLEIPAGATLKFPAGAAVDQLTFPEKCTLVMLADDTITTTTDGVLAKDGAGGVWVSQAMNIEGNKVYGFVKKK